MLTYILCLFVSNAYTQDTIYKQALVIKVPDFADPVTKIFYHTYADHLIKCIKAIREKNEAKTIALFKDPGEQLVAREKIVAKELAKNAADKQKYVQFAAEVYPFIKELEGSAYYKKMYGK